MSQASLQRPASPTRVSPVTGRKFSLLFLFLLADLLFYPYVGETTGTRYYIFRSIGVAVTLLGVYAISFRKTLIFIALVLAVPAILSHSLVFQSKLGSPSLFLGFLSFAFDVFIIVVIFRHVFGREKPTVETIFGALCIYLLVGFSFARLYALISAVRPHAFYLDPTTNAHSLPIGFDFIFFSFGAMTTAGANGIVAVSHVVRSFSAIESILGILYLAVMISRLVAAYQPNYPGSEES
jgi:hypothetical protein